MKKERRHYSGIAFQEFEITLARKMLDSLKTTVEFLCYLMDHQSQAPFSMILITTDKFQSINELQKMKRSTDLLFELDKEHGTYVFICQATDQEGGEKYAEILLTSIRAHRGISDTYCILSTFDSTHYGIQDVIFHAVETYIHARKVGQSGEVIVSRLDKEDALLPVK
jgi:hypothetical protein